MIWITELLNSMFSLRKIHSGLHIALITTLGPWHVTANASEQLPGENNLLAAESEELYFGDLPIVLSATRLTQPASKAPAAVTIIDREMIEESGARELADVFRLVPGFIVGSLDGNQRIVGYHGVLDAFNRRMQVLVDGRSIYTPLYSGVRWTDLPLAIEDIGSSRQIWCLDIDPAAT